MPSSDGSDFGRENPVETQDYGDLTNIVYGVEDHPPWSITVGQAVQHVALMSGNLVFPLIIARAMDASTEITAGLVAMTLLAGGIGTIFQAFKRPFGSGYLCPEGGSEPYIPAGIAAVQSGGLALFFGMTMLAGLWPLALPAAGWLSPRACCLLRWPFCPS